MRKDDDKKPVAKDTGGGLTVSTPEPQADSGNASKDKEKE